jgi:hypothetical protein
VVIKYLYFCISQARRLCKAKPISGPQSFWKPKDDDSPFATFRFKYRSLGKFTVGRRTPGHVCYV